MNRTLITLSIAALASTPFAADESVLLDGTTGFGIAAGAQRYNGSYGDNAMPYFRAHLEYHVTEAIAVRGIGGFGNISDGSSRFRTEWFSNIGIQGVYQPKIDALGNFRPYVASGASTDFGTVKNNGVKTFDLDWNFYLPVELGLEWLFCKNVSATAYLENRIHAVQWDKLDGIVTGTNYYKKRDELPRAGIGLTWRFGGALPIPVKAVEVVKQVVAPVAEKVVAPIDADNDGVIDALDKCSDTPPSVVVDAKGCPIDSDKDGVPDYMDKCSDTPASVAVDAKGCPIDSDKDGVSDYMDKCSSTPLNVAVDAKGCPIDSDKDGVSDYMDKCPNTQAGEKVDSTGCVEIKFEKGNKITLAGILFASGKSEIDPSSDPVLSHAAEAIKAAPKAKIEIAGFTDNAGKAKTNQALSAKRAEAVKTYLIKLGVPTKQIVAKGYGSAQPVADNKTDEGRAKNRRIEFRVK